MKTKEHNPIAIRFQEYLDKAGDPGKVLVRMPTGFLMKDTDEEVQERLLRTDYDKARTLRFIVSTPGTKRDGNEIDQAGWILDNYRSNPVFLWAHDGKDFPVGRAIDVWTGKYGDSNKERALKSMIEVMPNDLYAGRMGAGFPDKMLRAYNEGWMAAVSAGWAPVKWSWKRDQEGYIAGILWEKNDFAEHSAVPVPADPNALKRAIQSGTFTPEQLAMKAPTERDEQGHYILYLTDRTPHDYKIISVGRAAETVTQASKAVICKKCGTTNNSDASKCADCGADMDEMMNFDPQIALEETPAGEKQSQESHFEAEVVEGDFDAYDVAAKASADVLGNAYATGKLGLHHDTEGRVSLSALMNISQHLMRGDYAKESRKEIEDHVSGHFRKANITPPWQTPLGRLYVSAHQMCKEDGTDEIRDSIKSLAVKIFGTNRNLEAWEESDMSDQFREIAGIIRTAAKAIAGISPDEYTSHLQSYVRKIEVLFARSTDAYKFLQSLMAKMEVKNTTELLARLERAAKEPEVPEVEFTPDVEARLAKLAEKFGAVETRENSDGQDEDEALLARIKAIRDKLSPVSGDK